MLTDNTTNPLQQAIVEIGPYKVAEICGVKGPSVYKWLANGRLPRTEWTGESDYASKIAIASEGKYTREMLMKLSVVSTKQIAVAG